MVFCEFVTRQEYVHVTYSILHTRGLCQEGNMATRNLPSSLFPVHHTVRAFLAVQELWEWGELLLDELWIAERICVSGWVKELPCGRQRVRDKILGNECNKEIVFIVRSRTPSQPWRVLPVVYPPTPTSNQSFPVNPWPESFHTPLTSLVTMKGGSGVVVLVSS